MTEVCVNQAARLAGLAPRPSGTKSLNIHGQAISAPQYGNAGRAVRRESARSVEDVLARRTRALFLNAKAAAQMTPRVAQIVANELGRDKQWQDNQLVLFRALAQNYRVNESAHAGKFGPLGTTE
jgi:glycerol-3-phosphate dehydrogenase